MNSRSVLFLFLLLKSAFAFSQSIQRYAFSSAGSLSSGLPLIQSNIGELMSDTYLTSGTMLTQGFVQNDQVSVNVDPHRPADIQSKAFPNPVSSHLNITISSCECADLLIEIFDYSGKKLVSASGSSFQSGKGAYELSLEGFSPGIYFISVRSDKDELNQVFRITKI
ncbi:MAG: hypothetical protein JWO44_1559 [Bacteroidetes bacterium]|nr:hypothetical protein [Bacteroidota bacterium]